MEFWLYFFFFFQQHIAHCCFFRLQNFFHNAWQLQKQEVLKYCTENPSCEILKMYSEERLKLLLWLSGVTWIEVQDNGKCRWIHISGVLICNGLSLISLIPFIWDLGCLALPSAIFFFSFSNIMRQSPWRMFYVKYAFCTLERHLIKINLGILVAIGLGLCGFIMEDN